MAYLLVGGSQHAANVPCQWQQRANRDQRQHGPRGRWPLQIGRRTAHQPPPSIRQGDGNISRASPAPERQQFELLAKQRVMRIGNGNARYYPFEISGSLQCSVIPPLPTPCWTGLCMGHTASNSKERACENYAPPKPGLTKRPFSSPNSSACDPHRYPAGIIGMPGWLRSEQRAGFDRNRWLQSSEYATVVIAGTL